MAINLQKGQTISLAKETGSGLEKVFLGLGWGRRSKKGFFGTKEVDVDLDASCLMFDDRDNLVDTVWFRQLKSQCGTVVHSGDDRAGGGSTDDDNERIQVDLKRLPFHVQQLVFTVNSFLGDSFEGIPNAVCRLFDVTGNKEIARFNLSLDGGSHTGLIMAKLSRRSGDWEMQALGAHGDGRTFDDLMPVIKSSL